MALLSPIAIRLKADGGTQAQFTFRADVNKSNYDPRDPGVYTPPAPPTPLDILGVYEKAPQEGLETTLIGKFMFPTDTPIAALDSYACEVLVNSVKHLAVNVRRRWYRGALDGYSMDLHKGP